MSFARAYKECQMSDYAVHGSYIDYDVIRTTTSREEYVASFRENVECVHKWAEGKRAELAAEVKKTLEDPHDTDEQREAMMNDTLALSHEILRFCEAVNLNEDAVHELLKECKVQHTIDVYDRCMAAWKEFPFHFSEQTDEILVDLNKLFVLARNDENMRIEMLPGSEGTQSFERRSIKFWVHHQDLPTVLATVSRHLPINTDRSKITSVYFDTPDVQLYHQRMERLEGSFLIRIRWYGDKDKDVFMERKVHHEAWLGESSTKQRFSIAEKNVMPFIRGQWDIQGAVDHLKKKGAKESEIRNFSDLVDDVSGKFHTYDLQPMLRSRYTRTAFQFAHSAAVRVSVDTNMVLSRERPSINNWRNPNPTPSDDDIHFPYAVVEVKLQLARGERHPEWVTKLMHHAVHMESVPKFSKYAHGICSLYKERTYLEPYWLHQVSNDIRGCIKRESGFDIRTGIVSGCAVPLLDECVFGDTERYQHEWEYTPRQSRNLTMHYYRSILSDTKTIVPELCHLSVRNRSYARHGVADVAEHTQCSCCACAEAKQEDETDVHRLGLNGMIPWQTGKCIRVPKKTDPKTFITSERYLLHWVSLAVRVAFAGTIAVIISQRTSGVPSHVSHFAGVCAIIFSVVVMMYALMIYRLRTLRMFTKTVVRYDDPRGPILITLAMIFMVAMLAFVPLYNILFANRSITPITPN
eukprot:PhM_4_TR18600/c0_g1_i1/m.30877